MALLNDAFAFVRYFGIAIARHIDISALPFARTSSCILNQYLHEFPHTLTLKRGEVCRWPALEMTTQAHDKCINAVAFSPDGHRTASPSDDHTVCVWDSTTGEAVAGPLTGHINSVTSVAFSPDAQRIVSASDDCTVWVWDATTGQVVASPFTEHTSFVTQSHFRRTDSA
jgi:WD40 repeat protein